MQSFVIKTINSINTLNELLFKPIDNIIGNLNLPYWLSDAIIDSIHMLPFLFFIFIIIELIEQFYGNKINKIAEYSDKAGPLIGTIAASVPQCGFSVIASALYTKRFITKGTLLAVYLATSDEAIPVILSNPEKIKLIIPLLITKLIIALCAGYSIDFFLRNKINTMFKSETIEKLDNEEGCCKHNITQKETNELFIHPIKHTLNVFIFVLLITIGLNYLIHVTGGEENIGKYFLQDTYLQPILTGIIGLIPNCAISIAITLMYLKGAISFGAVIAGLSSSAGLGILVLLKKNESVADSIKIILLLLLISILSGTIIQIFDISPII